MVVVGSDVNSETKPLKNCTSGPGDSCQFRSAAHEYNGRDYCIFHAPLEASFKCSFHQLQAVIESQPDGPTLDLTGAVFPETKGTEYYRFTCESIARRCTFAPGVRITVDVSVDISHSECLGNFDALSVNTKIIAREVLFSGDVTVAGCQNADKVDFTESTVSGNFRISQLTAKMELRLDGMTLAHAPAISVDTSPAAMPQNSSIRRLKLLKTA